MSQSRPNRPLSAPARPPQWQPQRHWLYALWKFSRPHTIIGTSLSVLSLYWVTVAAGMGTGGVAQGFDRLNAQAIVTLLGPALLACLAGNVYIVGLNQLEDIEIDRINKPHLPLASGEFSLRQGQAIVGVAGLMALLVSASQGLFLMATVWVSLLIGTAYSLPPIRLKRFPVWASLCIFTVRGAIVNLGLFAHFSQRLLGRFGEIPPTVWALTLFVLVFTVAIAIFKDIPDSEGDRRYNISTFTLRLGTSAVFNGARWILTACYLGMIGAGLVIPGVNAVFLIITHALALGLFWWCSLRVDLNDRGAIARFYQFIWKLFFLEYVLFPLACLLR